MRIRLPAERTYYSASPDEPNRVMCWIPRAELEVLVSGKRAPSQLLEDNPLGLEIEMSEDSLRACALDLGISAEVVCGTFMTLRDRGQLPASGYVQGAFLENAARTGSAQQGNIATLEHFGAKDATPHVLLAPEPAFTEGDDPATALAKMRAAKRA